MKLIKSTCTSPYPYRRPLVFLVSSLLAIALYFAPHSAAVVKQEKSSAPAGEARPVLVLSTRLGTIEIQLLPSAAPAPVETVVGLAQGPIFETDLLPEAADEANESGPQSIGFYDGLAFSYTKPHIEIATETRHPSALFTVESLFDAEALGLDERIIEDRGQAMDVFQRELMPEFVEHKKRGTITEKLRHWLDLWYADHQADFLVGVSRKEINEALGYEYRQGLASQPPRRGAVALWPASSDRSTLRLTILLEDLEARTGRWMVIGRVIRGLEVAEKISVQPLEAGTGHRSFEPANPIRISTAVIELRERTELRCTGNPSPKGGAR